MTLEDKELLLKDLCARLPYGGMMYNTITKEDIPIQLFACMTECRPYLRPMSSMTEEEMEEYNKIWDLDRREVLVKSDEYKEAYRGKYPNSIHETPMIPWFHHIDWLISHHFDFRGLIPMGLALVARDGMYNTPSPEGADILEQAFEII